MKAIAFDMDGTLIDSIPVYTEIGIEILMKHFGLSEEESSYIYKNTLGHPFKTQLEISNLFSENAVREYEKLTREVSVNSEPFEGALEYLKRFDNLADTYIGIVSSSSIDIVAKVEQKYFPGVFDWISGIEAGPKDFQIIMFLNEYSIDPIDTTLFGDTETDRTYAKKVGAEFYKVDGNRSWQAYIGSLS